MWKRTATMVLLASAGTILLVAPAGLFLSICLFPTAVFRVVHGRDPLTPEQYRHFEEIVRPGMTPQEVRTVVGEPHEVSLHTDGTVNWFYYPSASLGSSVAGVYFDKAGVVTRSVTQI